MSPSHKIVKKKTLSPYSLQHQPILACQHVSSISFCNALQIHHHWWIQCARQTWELIQCFLNYIFYYENDDYKCKAWQACHFEPAVYPSTQLLSTDASRRSQVNDFHLFRVGFIRFSSFTIFVKREQFWTLNIHPCLKLFLLQLETVQYAKDVIKKLSPVIKKNLNFFHW